MDIGTTIGEATDRGRGGVINSQGRCGQDMATKSNKGGLDVTGNLEVGIPEDINS